MGTESREEYLKRINSTHLECPHEYKDAGDSCKCAFCGRQAPHDDDYRGVGGSGDYWVCTRCGRERDEYEGRVPD